MKFLVLAILQGLTEFIPVSSSGHLALAQKLFGIEEPMLAYDIMLHLATVLAVIVFLRADLALIVRQCLAAISARRRGKSGAEVNSQYPYFRLVVLIGIAIVPAIVIGLVLDETIDRLFSSLTGISIGFFWTGTVLFLTRFARASRTMEQLKIPDALAVGLAQALAIIPGVSRSGMTIAAGMFRGIDKTVAARFSFLLSVPTILAAAVYKLPEALHSDSLRAMPVVAPFLAAFVSGYAALVFLSRLIARAQFYRIAFYCWAAGLVAAFLAITGR